LNHGNEIHYARLRPARQPEAWIIARIAAVIGAGSVGQAMTTLAKSRREVGHVVKALFVSPSISILTMGFSRLCKPEFEDSIPFVSRFLFLPTRPRFASMETLATDDP